MQKLLKSLSAWLPIAMSIAALLWLVGFIVLRIPQPQGDEGIGAHVFQLLMLGQVPIVLFFLSKWFSKKPTETIKVFLLQIAIAGIPFIVLYLAEH